jgi:hypothetical protein
MKTTVTAKTYLRILTLVTFAQVFILIIFSGVILFLYNGGQVSDVGNLTGLFQTIIPGIVILSLLGGYFIFKKIVDKTDPSSSLKEKLVKYQQAILIRSAFLELIGFSGGVASFMTGKIYFLGATLLSIVLFYMLRPTVFSITEDLKLSSTEKKLLENPGSVLYEN